MSSYTVLITRPDGEEFAQKVRARGFEAITLPLFSLAPINDAAALALVQNEIFRFQWLIFTSRHGVRFFAAELQNELPADIKIAAIGAGTSAEIEEQLGRKVNLCGSGESSEDFLPQIIPLITAGEKVMLVSGSVRRGIIERALTERGIDCETVELYRQEQGIITAEQRRRVEAIPTTQQVWTFFSPSAFTFARAEFSCFNGGHSNCKIFSIGKVTSAAIREAGLSVSGEAQTQSEEGMLEAIATWRAREG